MGDRLQMLLELLGEDNLPPRMPTPPLDDPDDIQERSDTPSGEMCLPTRTTSETDASAIASADQTAVAPAAPELLPSSPVSAHVPSSDHTIPANQAALPPGVLSAVEKAFNVKDVLALVLDLLPMKDLLLAQRISRCFREIIQGEPRYRRRLFLDEGNIHDVHENKMAMDTLYIDDIAASPDDWMEQLPDEHYAEMITFNPLLVQQCLNISGRSPLQFKAMPRILSSLLTPDLSREASCRQMFLTQPALRMVTTSVNVNANACERAHLGTRFLSTLENEAENEAERDSNVEEEFGAGVTLGAMLNELQRQVAKTCKYMQIRSDPDCNWTFGLGVPLSQAGWYMEDWKMEDELWASVVTGAEDRSKENPSGVSDEEWTEVEECCDGKFVERGWLESVD